MNQTINYYDQNATDFTEGTKSVDMRALYNRFLPLLPDGGSILDAGCGSGRDALAFKNLGFAVEAFDASASLVELASAHIGQSVHHADFLSFRSNQIFDGIWACASLLHVPTIELKAAIANLADFLKNDGVFYVSFKYGSGERKHHGREFTDMNEAGLEQLVSQISVLTTVDIWITGDARPGRDDEKWLNAIIRKTECNNG